MKYNLKQHHQQAIKILIKRIQDEKKNNVALELPTGSGNTTLSIAVIYNLFKLNNRHRILFICDRVAILEQLRNSMQFIGDSYSISVIDKIPPHNSQFTSSQVNLVTLKRLERSNGDDLNIFLSNFSCILLFSIHNSSPILESALKNISILKIGISSRFNRSILNLLEEGKDNSDYKFSLEDAIQDRILDFYYETKENDSPVDFETRLKVLRARVLIPNISHSYPLISSELNSIINDLEVAYSFIKDDQDLLREAFKLNLSKQDLKELAYKKAQINFFEKLLSDEAFFNIKKEEKESAEKVWQAFFEDNPWIFGFGLNVIFTSNLNEKKLEQLVSGFNFNSGGKSVDGLLKTRGLIESLRFVEIKTHTTPLLHNRSYRKECWRISEELSGAVSQIQKTVQKSIVS